MISSQSVDKMRASGARDIPGMLKQTRSKHGIATEQPKQPAISAALIGK